MIERTSFLYFVCPECHFDMVQTVDFAGARDCPLCADGFGETTIMVCRPCRSTDRPEGFDARFMVRKPVQRNAIVSESETVRVLRWAITDLLVLSDLLEIGATATELAPILPKLRTDFKALKERLDPLVCEEDVDLRPENEAEILAALAEVVA